MVKEIVPKKIRRAKSVPRTVYKPPSEEIWQPSSKKHMGFNGHYNALNLAQCIEIMASKRKKRIKQLVRKSIRLG